MFLQDCDESITILNRIMSKFLKSFQKYIPYQNPLVHSIFLLHLSKIFLHNE